MKKPFSISDESLLRMSYPGKVSVYYKDGNPCCTIRFLILHLKDAGISSYSEVRLTTGLAQTFRLVPRSPGISTLVCGEGTSRHRQSPKFNFQRKAQNVFCERLAKLESKRDRRCPGFNQLIRLTSLFSKALTIGRNDENPPKIAE